MEITGRVTADAEVRETKSGKKVVGFNLAINDNYRGKDGQMNKVTTWVDCSYWLNGGIAVWLKKGILVELYGRIGARAWTAKSGEAKASLTFHVNNIKLLGKSNAAGTERVTAEAQTDAATYPDTKDDLPF
jgi:single-strand DNA-binding protein